jgi:hypothetical protein
MTIPPVGTELSHVSGQADRHDEASSNFSQFCENLIKQGLRNRSRNIKLTVRSFLLGHLSWYACNETNLMHYLSSVYWVTSPLHVSGLLVAHRQEVTVCICNNWYVLYVLVDCRRAVD